MNKVKERRTERELTQAELAKLAGITRLTVTRIEGGAVTPSSRTMANLARALDCQIEELLEDE